jgi:hypothetical protein
MHVSILAHLARLPAGVSARASMAVTILAAAMAMALVDPASADHDDSIHFPAESMTYGPFAKVTSDPEAFGGKALRYAEPARAARSVALSAKGERIVLRARNATSSGSSRSSVGLRVTVDGAVVGEKLITSTSYAYYSFDIGVPVGTRKVGVEAYSLDGQEKVNLDAVRIVPKPPPADADRDGDGFDNAVDNRPDTYNPGQPDLDGDQTGDFADPDKDGDGVVNDQDPAPKKAAVPGTGGGIPPADCDVTISPGEDLDAIVNSDPATAATKFCVKAGTYQVNNTAVLKSGDTLTGPAGATATVGPAVYPVGPAVRLVGDDVDRVVSLSGSNITVRWLDISGADGRIDPSRPSSSCPSSPLPSGCPVVGTGIALAMGQADGTVRAEYLRLHNNDANGISNANGRIKHVEAFSNTEESAFLGVTAAAIKGIHEFEAAQVYSHDEQGIGIWHDHALSGEANVPQMSTNPGGGTWVHDNVLVNNNRYGIRFEYSPRDAAEGEHLATPTFLAENNRVAGNGNAGASHADAQNGTWTNNVFGPQTISGVSYGHNFNNKALVVRDSGRSDRTDTWNAVVKNNTLGGEAIEGCAVANTVCSGNTT